MRPLWLWFARFLICLTFITALPACISTITFEEARQLNSAAEIAESCVRSPTADDDTDLFAHKMQTGQTMSNGESGFREFVKTADIIYRYDPNLPHARSSTLPWPYQRMTCEKRSSSDTPPLPEGMQKIPLTEGIREALVSSLSQECGTAFFEAGDAYDKRLLGDIVTVRPGGSGRRFSTERVQEIGQMLRDAIRGALPKVPAGNEPTDGQISIIDTTTNQVLAGGSTGAIASVVPGGFVIAEGSNQLRQPTREYLLAQGGVQLVSGTVQAGVGGTTFVGGAGVLATGAGAPAGVFVCGAGAAVATNGIINMCHGAKTVILTICHWNELPSAGDAQPLAATAMGPKSPGAGQTATTGKAPQPAVESPAPKVAPTPAKPTAQSNTSTASTAQPNRSPGGQLGSGTQKTPNTKVWVKCTGQKHHAISAKIHRALERHKNLKGVYKYRDNRFVTQALDKKAHNGYQSWHIALDKEIADWIDAAGNITPKDFEAYLIQRYAKSDLKAVFPNGF